MKKSLILMSISIMTSNAFGESVAPIKDKYMTVSADKNLEKLLEIPDVKKIYDKCKSNEASFNEKLTLADCVWAGVKTDSKLKTQVLEKYNTLSKKESDDSRSPASSVDETNESENNTANGSMVSKKFNMATNYADDPQVKALTEFFRKKLDEVLSPEKTKKNGKDVISSVDHSFYIKLYESELGRTIVNAFTSYCIETDSSCGVYDENTKTIGSCDLPSKESDRNANRNRNISNIKNLNISLESNTPEGSKWVQCIAQVNEICTNKPDSETEQKPYNRYSEERACLIVDYVKSARENLIAIEEQNKFWDENRKNGSLAIADNFNVIDEKTNDKATSAYLGSITSTDISKVSKKVDEKALAKINECFQEDENGQNARIVNAEACKDFLETNKEEADEALAEFTLRQNAQQAMIEEKLSDSNTESLEKYLEDEGYSKDEIASLLSSNDPKSVADLVKIRFENEKEALIKEMKDRIGMKTSKKDGEITEEDLSSLQKIKKELQSRSTDLADSVLFNNVVSSYLDIQETSGNEVISTNRNVASLFAEVESMEDKEQAKKFQDKIDEAKLKNTKNSSTLALKNLNNMLLSYFKGQSSEKADKNKAK